LDRKEINWADFDGLHDDLNFQNGDVQILKSELPFPNFLDSIDSPSYYHTIFDDFYQDSI
jgi:hypothetical protein